MKRYGTKKEGRRPVGPRGRRAARRAAAAGLCLLAAAFGPPLLRPSRPGPAAPPPALRLGAAETDPRAAAALDPYELGERLIDAIILVESAGDSARVGSAGERGLMQIKRDTWRGVTARLYGEPLPFRWAFHPGWNRRVGRAYLARLHDLLAAHRDDWRADERTLLLAAYNAGPARLAAAGFDPARLPASTRDYAARVAHLHDEALAEGAALLRARLLAAAPAAAVLPAL